MVQALLSRIGPTQRYFVEFGSGAGTEGNCVLLADHYGWRGLFIEADHRPYVSLERKYRDRPQIITLNARATPHNIESLLRSVQVPMNFGILSLDVDGNDFWIWQSIQRFRPSLVIVEYNGNLALDDQVVMPYNACHRWDGTDYFGASLGAYVSLAATKRYDLVHTERTGTNAFFLVHERTIAACHLLQPLRHAANYFGRGDGMPRDPSSRPFMDLRTGRLVQAKRI